MYNIEEKIKNWYKNQTKKPIVSSDDEDKENKSNSVKTSTMSRKVVNGIIEKPKTRDELLGNLQKYVNKLSDLHAGQIEEYEELDIKTDEEILDIADKQSEESYKNAYLKENLKNETQIRELNDKKKNAVANSKSEVQGIVDYYDSEVKEVNDSAIKNGISRSSILNAQVEDSNKSKEKETKKVLDDLDETIKTTDFKIKDEEKRHEIAVDDIDKSKEEKRQQIIKDLKAQRDKITGFENFVAVDFDGQIKNTTHPTEEMLDIYNSVINDCLNYYKSLDSKTATEEYLNDEEIQKILGDMESAIRTYVTGRGQAK